MVTLSRGLKQLWQKAEDDAATVFSGKGGELGKSLKTGGTALDSVFLPTECSEDEVHDKEGAEEDEGAEVDPRPSRTARVLHLTTGQKAQGKKTKRN